MKSLEARKKFRAEQKAERLAENTDAPQADAAGDGGVPDYLALSVAKFTEAVGELSLEQLDELEAAEFGEKGAKRAGIKNAIEASRASRKAVGSGWNANAS